MCTRVDVFLCDITLNLLVLKHALGSIFKKGKAVIAYIVLGFVIIDHLGVL